MGTRLTSERHMAMGCEEESDCPYSTADVRSAHNRWSGGFDSPCGHQKTSGAFQSQLGGPSWNRLNCAKAETVPHFNRHEKPRNGV